MNIQEQRIPLKGEIILPQAEYEALINHTEEFDVICFQVLDSSNTHISPLFETREQAKTSLSAIKNT